ncbi:Holliday junction DNA helicase subunit RuvA [Albimonas donghaensis]|uniref:Holliday junction branch migration complex subunit RuvA n=1 Tax=Albimonas donghaensis TaxID=356660 RepID=A0A1H2W7W1_9RHOB|nr:Holliday junction branch migration protein RuvA [Albimonas donghaensis]SDW76344.1 Holliday junction DNA helicase subunit RuvA [Albimonas donghaensis]
MIGKISGRIDYIAEDHVLIEAAGVGYVVHASTRTLAALPGPGEFAALYTEMVVREDLMQLYGFPTLVEKEWHRLLVSVQGVGPKHALAMLGLLGTDGVGRAIGLGDAGALRRAPGVGPKLAERVVLELRSKAPTVMAMGARGARPALAEALVDDPEAAPAAPASAHAPAAAPKKGRKPAAPSAAQVEAAASAAAQADALSALVNLGYPEGQAAAAVMEAADAEPGPPEPAALIRAALRALSPVR